MQLSRKSLNARWAWTSAAAVVVLGVLAFADARLRAKTGFGTADLQGVSTGWGLRQIFDRWTIPPDAALAGFDLGFDYLLMPLYGAALYFGAIAARERFAPKPGRARRIMAILAMAPIAASLCDACENALQMAMLLGGPSDALARLTLEATTAKFAGISIGLLLSLAALAALIGAAMSRKKKSEEDGDLKAISD